MLVLSRLFHSLLSPSSRGSLVPLHFLPLGWCHLHIWGYWYFSWQSWFQLELHSVWHFAWFCLHISWISRGQYIALMYSFPDLEPVICSMSGSTYCFLTCMQVSQETGKMVWYSHLFRNCPQFVVIHTVKGFGLVNEKEVDVFLEFPLLCLWSNRCWKFDLWFLCLFHIQLEDLKVLSSRTVEVLFERFWALPS